MMKQFLIALIITASLGILSPGVFADTVYHVADYYPMESGNIWFFQRDIFLMGPQTHEFQNHTGRAWYDVLTVAEQYGFMHLGEEGLLFVGLGFLGSNDVVDLTDTPIVIAAADCEVGWSFTTEIPPNKLDPDDDTGLSITSTLAAVEDITTPAGTFHGCLKFNIYVDDSGGDSWYREVLWLAKGVGPVKISRPDEDPDNHEGCFMTCGAFNGDGEVVERDMLLEAFLASTCGDVNGDGKIGVDDAVKALQTVSGIR